MNTNTPKVLLYIIIGVLAINLLFNLFGSGAGLKQAVKNLENARKSIDTALHQLNDANTRLDSIRADLDQQRETIKSIYVSTQIIDLEKKAKDARKKAEADSIRSLIATLKDYRPDSTAIIETITK
jgi:F0F1-type ATP synthase membrane subunit b/b'